jgi:hypothetical protein
MKVSIRRTFSASFYNDRNFAPRCYASQDSFQTASRYEETNCVKANGEKVSRGVEISGMEFRQIEVRYQEL